MSSTATCHTRTFTKHISSCFVCFWRFLLARRQRPFLHSPFSRFMNHFSKRLIYNPATPLLLSSWKPFSLFLLYVKKYEEKYCSKNINYLSHSGRKFTSCLHLRHTEFMQFPSVRWVFRVTDIMFPHGWIENCVSGLLYNCSWQCSMRLCLALPCVIQCNRTERNVSYLIYTFQHIGRRDKKAGQTSATRFITT